MSEEIIRLYEFDHDKPDLSEEFLEHHGILGMKWGVRKERATGKGRISKHKAKKLRKRRIKTLKKARKARMKNRLEEQQKQKTKDDIIKSKDIASMLKNVDKFSNQEINDMLTRLDTEGRLAERVSKMNKANQSTGKKVANALKENVAAGAKSAGSSLVRTVTENALKMGVRKLAESAATNEQQEEFIKALLKEKKK